MTRILLSVALLFTVMSEHLAAKDHREMPSHVILERFRPGKGILIPRGAHALASESDERRPRRDEATRRFFEGSPQTQSPSFALISNSNPKKKFISTDLRNPDDAECCDGVKPMLLFSIDLRKMLEGVESISESCDNVNCRLHQGWKVQEPFYVEEPEWIEINTDYTDSLIEVDKEDPFFVSRGKKIYRIKNDIATNRFDDYETSSQDDKDLNFITKQILRTQRSVAPREINEQLNEMKINRKIEKKNDRNLGVEKNNYRYVENLVKSYERDGDPFFVSRGKKIKISKNENLNNKKSEQHLSSMDFDVIHGNEKKVTTTEIIRGKRSLPLKEIEKSPNIDIKLNNKIDRFPTYSFNHFLQKTREEINYDNRKKENQENLTHDKDFIENKNTLENNLIRGDNQNKSKYLQNQNENLLETNFQKTKISRDKRSVCDDLVCKEDATTQKTPNENFKTKNEVLLKEVEDVLNDYDYLDRRDKHSELMDILGEPFFISRGKKKSRETEISEYRTKQREVLAKANFYDNLMDDIAVNIMKLKILETLIQRRTKCLNEECDPGRIVKRKPPRDRRGALDDLLTKHDPFYVARGKRVRNEDDDSRIFKTPIDNENMKLKNEEINQSHLIGRRNVNRQ